MDRCSQSNHQRLLSTPCVLSWAWISTPLEPRIHRQCAFPEPCASGAAEPVVVISKHHPVGVHVKLDDCEIEFLPSQHCTTHTLVGAGNTCPACNVYPGIVAVKPLHNIKPWTMYVNSSIESGARQVRVIRTQVPLATVKASTLHVLQGTTADHGLIFCWNFPRLLPRGMRWLAIYVALSRVRHLKNM